MNHSERITHVKEQLARRVAMLVHLERRFHEQHSQHHPDINRARLADIDAWRVRINSLREQLNELLKTV